MGMGGGGGVARLRGSRGGFLKGRFYGLGLQGLGMRIPLKGNEGYVEVNGSRQGVAL